MASLQYRPEIDGLRSFAVLPVILFHAGFETFSGGYVGVDIFFVISGFLITSLILKDINQDKFSLFDFYERRIRRILPALMAMIVICIPFAWMWMLPNEFGNFSKSVAATNLYISNFTFWREAGYFGTQSELKPLLHTWSLAIEEQFYVFFPLCLILLAKFSRKTMFILLSIVFLASLAIAEFGTRNYPGAAFYLLPMRAWELGAGSLLAFIFVYRQNALKSLPKAASELGAILGMMLIGISVFGFDQGTAFPSPYGAIPVLGTVLVIAFARTETLVGKFLQFKLLVGIGLLSYSAYLWHQPLLAFARLRLYDQELGLPISLALIIATFVMAYLSWRFVERPFRNRDFLTREQIFGYFGAATLVLVSAGLVGFVKSEKIASHMPEKVMTSFEEATKAWDCSKTIEIADGVKNGCIIGSREIKPTIAIMGDSHAHAFLSGMEAMLAEHDLSAIAVTDNWCAPLYDFGTRNPRKNRACRDMIKAGFDRAFADDAITDVILVGQWANYTKGVRWNDYYLTAYEQGNSRNDDPSANVTYVSAGFEQTIKLADKAGKKLTIFTSVPEYKTEVPRALARDIKFGSTSGEKHMREQSVANYNVRNAEVMEIFSSVAKQHVTNDAVTIIDAYPLFCGQESCRIKSEKSGVAYYKDSNHLSTTGSLILADAVETSLSIGK